MFAPRLTAIFQPSWGIGTRAVRLLLDRLGNPDLQHREHRMASHSVHRDWCGCPP